MSDPLAHRRRGQASFGKPLRRKISCHERARLGDPAELRSVEEARVYIAELLRGTLGRHLAEADADHQVRQQPLIEKKSRLRQQQRERRTDSAEAQVARTTIEARQRAQRFRPGLRGIWDRLTGRHAKIRRENEAEAAAALHRNAAERQALIQSQLQERRQLQHELSVVRRQHNAEVTGIYRDMAAFVEADEPQERQQATQSIQPAMHRNRRGPAP